MWKRGEKSELARRAGISRSHLGNILARRTRANAELAKRLAAVCEEMRLPITKEEWVFNYETRSRYFFGRAQ